jgi:hypothetical protein
MKYIIHFYLTYVVSTTCREFVSKDSVIKVGVYAKEERLNALLHR